MPLYSLKPALLALSAGGLLGLLTVSHVNGENLTLTTLGSFKGTNGAYPVAGLLQGKDGNFYGTTSRGGTNGLPGGWGTIFQITPTGTLTSLVSFNQSNGSTPLAGLLQTPDGNLYGTTFEGGVSNLGTVFRATTNGILTTLLSFTNDNGFSPSAKLALGADGYLYGTTQGANPPVGPNKLGTVFKMTTNGSLTTLIFFNGANGANPNAEVIQGVDGSLYGTTANGGVIGGGLGTVFRLTTNGSLSTLVSFNGTNGANPYGGLVQDVNGVLYGTTAYGGPEFDGASQTGLGTVFRLTTNGVFQTLYSFTGGTDGQNPWSRLVQGRYGGLYGTTIQGGMPSGGGWGTAFQITTNGILTSLTTGFNTQTGRPSYSELLPGAYGTYYGATYSFGPGSGTKGTVFRLDPGPPVLQSSKPSASTFMLSWAALIGQMYQVQYKTNLTQSNWIALGAPFSATNATMTVSDSIGQDPRRLYRVILSPLP